MKSAVIALTGFAFIEIVETPSCEVETEILGAGVAGDGAGVGVE
jgi:hypothetical protein